MLDRDTWCELVKSELARSDDDDDDLVLVLVLELFDAL